MKRISIFYCVIICALIISCNSNTNNNTANVEKQSKKLPEERTNVNPNPVKTYAETVKSFETTDEFKVSVYETKNTFRYLIKVSYKNLDGDDTLRIPNFGVSPQVEIKAGDTRPSCIIGFLDDENRFRESKLISFTDDALKITVLKHYGVSIVTDTVK